MPVLDVMSWIIGIANPLSALLVGTALALLLSRRPRLALWCAGVGWLVLLIAQVTFLTFGFKSGFPGFRFAQPLMIPVAAANFVCWVLLRRRRLEPRYEYAVRWAGRPRGQQTAWIDDEEAAQNTWSALRRVHQDVELLRRPVTVVEVVSRNGQIAEPSRLG
jgi:hypothetical protein